MISIQTNIAALYGQQNFQANSNFEQATIQQLTSGYRINSSADDAAGLAIANQLRAQTTELTQGVANANNGVSQLQIIDGGLNNIGQILNRLQTLATQAASSTFTGNFNTLNNEFQSDLGELNRQASNIGLNTGGDFNATLNVFVGGGIGVSGGEQIGTNVENINLGNLSAFYGSFSVTGTVSGSFSFASTVSATGTAYSATTAGNVAVAMTLAGTGYTMTGNALAVTVTIGTTSNSYTSTSVSALFTQTQAAVTSTFVNSVDAFSLGLATGTAATAATNLNITNVANAQGAITAIASAVVSLGNVQGVVGAGINQLNFAIGLAQSQIMNYTADQSGIRDANIAQEASNLTKSQVLSQSSLAALAQANQQPQLLLKLLQ